MPTDKEEHTSNETYSESPHMGENVELDVPPLPHTILTRHTGTTTAFNTSTSRCKCHTHNTSCCFLSWCVSMYGLISALIHSTWSHAVDWYGQCRLRIKPKEIENFIIYFFLWLVLAAYVTDKEQMPKHRVATYNMVGYTLSLRNRYTNCLIYRCC